MVKQSAEGMSTLLIVLDWPITTRVERIVQVGKKKMVLDHLIVQKMEEDNEVGTDVQSILMYGAQALFTEGEESSKDIICSYYYLPATGFIS